MLFPKGMIMELKKITFEHFPIIQQHLKCSQMYVFMKTWSYVFIQVELCCKLHEKLHRMTGLLDSFGQINIRQVPNVNREL